MPQTIRYFENMYLDISRILIAILSVLGVLSGAIYSSMGTYLLAIYRPPELLSYSLPIQIITTGTLAVFASSLASHNSLQLNRASDISIYLIVAVFILVIIMEAAILIRSTAGPANLRQWMFREWDALYHNNRWRLGQIEEEFGCCGFSNLFDLPSNRTCEKGRISGCFGEIQRHLRQLEAQAFGWTWIMLLFTSVLFVVGVVIYMKATANDVYLGAVSWGDSGIIIEDQPVDVATGQEGDEERMTEQRGNNEEEEDVGTN